ncbi:UDP-N-acetylmuramoyl-tripeptide--D-alanyl-D-alanine ligase [Bacillota bacterium]
MEKIKGIDIVKAAGGRLVMGNPEAIISGVSIDSRTAGFGTVFFALKGERTDGHEHIADAVKAGCQAIVAEREEAVPLEPGEDNIPVFIIVPDSEKALQDLAAWYLSQFEISKIGVTGSTGKTTTKDMLHCILSMKYKTVCNKGNFNNLIGLPLSVFDVDRTTEAAIFEMGMDRPGEIHRLAEIVRPDVAVITNIGISHLERLGSRENILKAKLEICDFMNEGNTLVINGDNDLLSGISGNKGYKVLRAGTKEDADICIMEAKDMGERGISFRLGRGEESGEFRIGAPGLHNCMNAALATGAAMCTGAGMEDAVAGLANYSGTDGRLKIISARGTKIIDDTYNASPDSMKAAIDVLAALKGTRKIAILGDMFELGDDEEKYHREVGEYASQKAIDVIISVGKNSEHISLAAKERGGQAFHFVSKDMLINVMAQWVRKGDAILVKGSRGMAMDEIARKLTEIREQNKEV